MDLPVIETPVAPRWVWMEEVTYSHIPIATLITAFLVLAPIFEYIGYRLNDKRFDRLARSMVFFCMILYSPGAALGTGIPMFIIGLWPEFWARWANLFFWPLIFQFIFFLVDVGFLFFGYYLPWDRMQNRKRLHIFFGVMTAVFGLLIQAVWDSLGAYMTTPGAPLPAVGESVGWSAAAFFNPSYPYLFFHRFFANISYAMLLTGGVFALKRWRQKDPEEKAYFGFAADFTFTIGFLTFFAMPFIGWGFARVLQDNAPVAFHSIMGGHASIYFMVKMGLIALMLLLAGGYLFYRYRKKALLWAMTIGIASLYIVLHAHPPLDWFGSPVTWRLSYTIILIGFLVFLWFIQRGRRDALQKWRWPMFVAGLAAFFTFALGGFVRERARQPYNVYGELVKVEVLPHEADRFLLYEKCIGCHHKSPNDLKRYEPKDWAQRVEIERKRPGVEITDEEAVRIMNYLKEYYR
ncbi:cytochrome ubiquinol oxidase subunit I [Thermodesulfobacteriota bacterium]